MGIFLLLVCWDRELLLFVVKCTPPLRVYAIVVLSDHCNVQCHGCTVVSLSCPSLAPLAANADNNASFSTRREVLPRLVSHEKGLVSIAKCTTERRNNLRL